MSLKCMTSFIYYYQLMSSNQHYRFISLFIYQYLLYTLAMKKISSEIPSQSKIEINNLPYYND